VLLPAAADWPAQGRTKDSLEPAGRNVVVDAAAVVVIAIVLAWAAVVHLRRLHGGRKRLASSDASLGTARIIRTGLRRSARRCDLPDGLSVGVGDGHGAVGFKIIRWKSQPISEITYGTVSW
jgi:hypothetical protein